MRLLGTGALANAANRRGDHTALLALRLQEMVYARETGNPRFVDTVETNVGFTLTAMKRHDEALVHYMAVAHRVGAPNDPNMAWALHGAIESLLALDRLDEAQALIPRATAAGAAVDMPLHVAALPMLAAARERLEDAARLIGYARRMFAERRMRLGTLGESLDVVRAKLTGTGLSAHRRAGGRRGGVGRWGGGGARLPSVTTGRECPL